MLSFSWLAFGISRRITILHRWMMEEEKEDEAGEKEIQESRGEGIEYGYCTVSAGFR